MKITADSCVLGLVMVCEVFLLKNIAKDWLGFLPLLRRVSQDTSFVLVHGYSSCDLGLGLPQLANEVNRSDLITLLKLLTLARSGK
jgi:hypothetical protein